VWASQRLNFRLPSGEVLHTFVQVRTLHNSALHSAHLKFESPGMFGQSTITHRRPLLIFLGGGPDWLNVRFKLMPVHKKTSEGQVPPSSQQNKKKVLTVKTNFFSPINKIYQTYQEKKVSGFS
jgi:hypothetical protein